MVSELFQESQGCLNTVMSVHIKQYLSGKSELPDSINITRIFR